MIWIDGEPIELYWIIVQDLRRWKSTRISKRTCTSKTLNLNSLEAFYSCQYSRTSIGQNRNSENSFSNSQQVKNFVNILSRREWSFFGPGDEEKWFGTRTYKSEGKWELLGDFKETRHQYCEESVLWILDIWRGNLTTVQQLQNTESWNAELLIRTIHSANQLILRTSIKLKWTVDSVDSRSQRVECGEVRSKSKRTVIQKLEVVWSEFFDRNSKL